MVDYIRLIISFFRLLFSGGFKDELKNVFENIRGENWERNLKYFAGTFLYYESERAEVLLGAIVDEFKNKEWDKKSIENAEIIFREIVYNGFEHGLKKDKSKKLKVNAKVAKKYFELKVEDDGTGFDLVAELEKQGALYRDGRNINGLTQVYRLARIYQIKENLILVFYRKGQTPINIQEEDGVVIVTFDGEIYDNSIELNSKIEDILNLHKDTKIILNFGEDVAFKTSRTIRLLTEPLEKNNKMVAICGIDNVHVLVKEYMSKKFDVFQEFEDAFDYLTKIPDGGNLEINFDGEVDF